MKLKNVKYLQQGGPVEAPTAAPAAEMQGQGNPEEQMEALAQQLVEMLMQNLGDPQAVAAVLQMALEMLQGAAQEAPVFKKGGKLAKKCGGKMAKKK